MSINWRLSPWVEQHREQIRVWYESPVLFDKAFCIELESTPST